MWILCNIFVKKAIFTNYSFEPGKRATKYALIAGIDFAGLGGVYPAGRGPGSV